jgi:hypothetical protein
MTRTLSALSLVLCLALPAQALSIDLSQPNLSFPETVTPATKGCNAAPTAETCPKEG